MLCGYSYYSLGFNDKQPLYFFKLNSEWPRLVDAVPQLRKENRIFAALVPPPTTPLLYNGTSLNSSSNSESSSGELLIVAIDEDSEREVADKIASLGLIIAEKRVETELKP